MKKTTCLTRHPFVYPASIFLSLFWIMHCASPHSDGSRETANSSQGNSTKPEPHKAEAQTRTFENPTRLDSLLDLKPQKLPKLVNAAPAQVAAKTDATSGNGPYRIQLEALPDMDAANRRKAVLDAKIGGGIEILFDAPYYKLRYGSYKTKQQAEEKLLEFGQMNLEGFIIRQ